MKTWKKVALTGSTVLAVVTLTACGSSTSSSTSSTNFKGETLTIGTWAGPPQETTAMNTQIKNFEKETGAKIVNRVYTNINQQLPADFAAKKAPDAFYLNAPSFPLYNKEGILKALDSAAYGSKSDFYLNQLNAFSANGNVYGVPKDVSTLAQFVNLDMLAKIGVKVSDIPTSYEGLISWLPGIQAKLDATHGKGKVVAFGYDQDLARLLPIAKAGNADFILNKGNGNSNLSSSAVLSNLDILSKLVATKAVATPAALGSSNDGEAFGTNKVLIVDDGNWDLQTLAQQYKLTAGKDFTAIPMSTYKGEATTMTYTVGWAESATSKVSALAEKRINYETSNAGMKIDCEGTGVLPTRPDLKSTVVNGNSTLEVFANGLNDGIPQQYGTNLGQVITSFNNFLPNALSGKITMASAMKQADAQANTAIKNGN